MDALKNVAREMLSEGVDPDDLQRVMLHYLPKKKRCRVCGTPFKKVVVYGGSAEGDGVTSQYATHVILTCPNCVDDLFSAEKGTVELDVEDSLHPIDRFLLRSRGACLDSKYFRDELKMVLGKYQGYLNEGDARQIVSRIWR